MGEVIVALEDVKAGPVLAVDDVFLRSRMGEMMGRNWRRRVRSSLLNSPDCAVKYWTP